MIERAHWDPGTVLNVDTGADIRSVEIQKNFGFKSKEKKMATKQLYDLGDMPPLGEVLKNACF